VRPEFRAGLIAGVIVLHASVMSGSPVGAALLRVADIALGAVIAILAARFVLPTHALQTSRTYAERALHHLSSLLALVARPAGSPPPGQIERVSTYARRAWRAAGRAAHEAHAERVAGKPVGNAPFQVVRELSRLHSDIGVIGRTLRHAMPVESVQEVAGALHRVVAEFRAASAAAGRTLLHGEPVPSVAALDAALAEVPRPETSAGTAALTQMLHLLRNDLANLLAVLERQRAAA
jgi:uncharacterized membrane protein YccC